VGDVQGSAIFGSNCLIDVGICHLVGSGDAENKGHHIDVTVSKISDQFINDRAGHERFCSLYINDDISPVLLTRSLEPLVIGK
jgi:hypothetical protein